MIRIQNLTKKYDDVLAVDGLNITVEDGSIHGILGPNGAGKSTTIRILLQIIAADSGTIEIDGRPMKPEDRDRIGYLPEERGLYPRMKCAETLRYFAALKSRPTDAALDADIRRWMDRFGLGDYLEARVEDLSKGMAQKLQIITSLIHDPEILILDEPFSGLDPLSQNQLLEVLQEEKQRGRTILFSTHIMDHAEKICDSIIIIRRGKELVGGRLEAVQRSLGTDTLRVVSDDPFPEDLENMPGVSSVLVYPRSRELVLEANADSQEILKKLLGSMKILKFELGTPSLHSIYSRIISADEQAASGIPKNEITSASTLGVHA